MWRDVEGSAASVEGCMVGVGVVREVSVRGAENALIGAAVR